MATTDVSERGSSEIFIKSSDVFEKEVKDRLFWSREQWTSAGEAGSRLNKLCNSLKYWKDKLGPACEDVSIIVTLYNANNDIKIDLITIILEIEKLNSNIKVQAFTEFRNPRYLGIYFNSKEERDYVFEKFRMINENYVVFLSWALEQQNNIRNLNMYWIPWTTKIKDIEDCLSKYVKCIESQRLTFTMMSGRIMPTGKVSFKVLLNDGVSVDSIPHLMKVSNLESLVTVSGRLPMCLNCGKLGHISKKCDMRFCTTTTCAILSERGHSCIKSYATAVKRVENNQPREDADDWSAVKIEKGGIDQSEEYNKEKAKLNNAIAEIQDKMKEINSNLNSNSEAIYQMEKHADGDTTSKVTFDQQSVDKDSQEDMSDVDEEKDLITSNTYQPIFSESEIIWPSSDKTGKKKTKVVSAVKKKLNTKNKVKIKNLKTAIGNILTDVNNEPTNVDDVMKSYGKPNYHNARRVKQEQKFSKLDPDQEFVFTD